MIEAMGRAVSTQTVVIERHMDKILEKLSGKLTDLVTSEGHLDWL